MIDPRSTRAVARVVPLIAPLPAVAIVAGVVALVVSALLGAAVGRALADWLPLDPSSVDPLEATAGGVGLVAIGLGLRRRKRLAWWMAVSVFVAAAVDQDAVAHPVAAGLAVGCLTVLAGDRRRYRVASDRRAVRPALAVAIVVVTVVVLNAALFDATGPLWAAPIASLGDAIDSLADVVAQAAPGLPGTTLLSGVGPAIDVAARLSLVVVALLALRAVPASAPPPEVVRRARSVARREASGALRPFQLGEDKAIWGSPGLDAAIVYGEAGRFAVMLGDPIGPRDDAVAALRAFTESSEVADRRPAAYQVSEAWRGEFERLGFRLVRVGPEAIVDLTAFDLGTPRRANLRHTMTRAQRGGVHVEWFPNGVADTAFQSALETVDREWRTAKRGPELRFTIHAFDAGVRAPTTVAFEADGAPSAFATFQPTGAGTWVLDLMRRRRGTPGALEWCIAEAATRLRAAGGRELSLGLAPLAQLRADGPIEERILALAAGSSVLRAAYDVRGLEFFKAKFGPRWEPRYLAIRSRTDLPGIVLALLRLHLAGNRASLVTVARTALASTRAR